ncbi:transposase [Pseudoalteromonas neustonica]|uniref:transposase n=1 Tax=Pseudoalteromonas neustonica TaxID=1840331 RepID=UPI003CCC4E22
MRNKYPQEFKDEAVRQIIIMATQFKGVTNRLGITDKLLYSWLTRLIKVSV